MANLSDSVVQEIKNRMGYGSMTQLALPYLEYAPIFELVVKQNVNDYGIAYITTKILPALQSIDSAMDPTGSMAKRFGIKELVGDVVFETGGIKGGATQMDMILSQKSYWLRELSKTVRIPLACEPGGGGSTSEVY